MVVSSLEIAAGVLVIFVIALTTEILVSCCRAYKWIQRRVACFIVFEHDVTTNDYVLYYLTYCLN